MDHDQFFKTLIREFFSDFFLLFFPDWAPRFDFSHVEWLDKELFLDPPHGEKRSVDLLARLPVAEPTSPGDETLLALVHIEVEAAQSVAPLRRRMFEYYEHIRHRFGLPVLPIGLYLRVGMEGLGWDTFSESFWENELVKFRYPYVGLPALDGEKYVGIDNMLGVALTALMRVARERRLEISRQAWRRLVQCPVNEYQKHLLCACVDNYAPLDEAQRQVFENDVLNEPNTEIRAMSIGLMEKYRTQGVNKGKGLLLLKQLEARFGPLPAGVHERIEKTSPEEKDRLALAVLTAKSLADLGLEGLPPGA